MVRQIGSNSLLWVTRTTVLCSARSPSTPRKRRAASSSRLLVGSSSSSTGGSPSRARAMAMRWRWPADSLHPALGGAVAVGQVDDELVYAGERGRVDDFLVTGIGQPVRDVVADRAGEENTLLRDVAAPSGELGAGELGDVGAVQQDSSRGRTIQALHQLEQRALAGGVAADEPTGAARRDGQIDAIEHRAAGFVAEAGVFDREDAFQGRQMQGAGLPLVLAGEELGRPSDGLREAGIDPPI